MKPIKHEDLGDQISGRVIGAALSVHRELGPGLDEADYEKALHLELVSLGIKHEFQVPLPLFYKGAKLDCGYRVDLVVLGSVLLELKALEKLHPVHEAQLLTYLRLANLNLGLLINFNVLMLRDGIVRRASSHRPAWKRQEGKVDSTGFDAVSLEILDAAIEVQCHLGNGLLKSAYDACLAHELVLRGLKVECGLALNLLYHERLIQSSKQLPLIVNDQWLVNCFCVDELAPIHVARSRSFLRAAQLETGLCINFHARSITSEIKRLRAR
ncbi:MAG: GxxExxY protein [Verrucomicrobiota bacterium]